MTLTIEEGLLREALAHLRDCGAGRRECVCWLLGPLGTPGLLDQVLHPVHRSSAIEYEVDGGWLNETFISMARSRRELRAQIHTHPNGAYHSATDDAFPAVTMPGFVSIVVPAFASAEALQGAHVSELTAGGTWCERELEKTLVIA